MKSSIPKSQILIVLALIICVVFNAYYFFIHRNRSPFSYLERIITGPEDPILTKNIYKDLSNLYLHLNAFAESGAIVFLGDSITKRFNVDEFFPEKKILNRGIYDDTTLGVLKRINHNINNMKIKKLFIMIGNNDLDYRSDELIVANIVSIIEKVHADEIFLQSILPVKASLKRFNERVIHINNLLKKNFTESHVKYIDLHSIFFKNGGIAPNLADDGVHPNYFGYKLWREAISEYLE